MFPMVEVINNFILIRKRIQIQTLRSTLVEKILTLNVSGLIGINPKSNVT